MDDGGYLSPVDHPIRATVHKNTATRVPAKPRLIKASKPAGKRKFGLTIAKSKATTPTNKKNKTAAPKMNDMFFSLSQSPVIEYRNR
ncbi:MAG: BRCT domain type II-containing protein [Mariniblastus sp.]